jgi:hypothetical protein
MKLARALFGFGCVVAVVAALAQILSRPLMFGEEPVPDARWIAGAEEAFRLSPPQRIGGQSLGWSITSDSRFVLFTELDDRDAERLRSSVRLEGEAGETASLPSQLPLRYWDRRSGRVGTIMEYDPRGGSLVLMETIEPLPLVLLVYEDERVEREYVLADFRHAKTVRLTSVNSGFVPEVGVLADGETVLFWETVYDGDFDSWASLELERVVVQVYDHRAGRLLASHTLEGVDLTIEDGTPYLYQVSLKEGADPQNFSVEDIEEKFWEFDPLTGGREPLEASQIPETEVVEADLEYSPALTIRKEELSSGGGTHQIRGSFLEAVEPPEERFARWAQVWLGAAGQFKTIDLSPDEGFVLYAGDFGTYVQQIERMPMEEFVAEASRQVRDEAVQNAKTSALGMIMYSSDYDDTLPMAHNFKDAVLPYVKNFSVLEGFNFLLNGEGTTTFDDPATTLAGTVETPFGRAEAYLDGHVEWVPYD